MEDLFGKKEKFFPAREIIKPDFSSFVAFDIETTGLARSAEIIEIGAVKVINGNITDSFSQLVKPKELISPVITSVTGITNQMVEHADNIAQVLPQFSRFAGNNVLVGHNALGFDCPIMGHWADIYGVYISGDVFDTLRFLRYRCEPFPGMESRRLSYLCEYFGIVSDTFHRAAADAEATAKLYFEIQQKAVPKKA